MKFEYEKTNKVIFDLYIKKLEELKPEIKDNRLRNIVDIEALKHSRLITSYVIRDVITVYYLCLRYKDITKETDKNNFIPIIIEKIIEILYDKYNKNDNNDKVKYLKYAFLCYVIRVARMSMLQFDSKLISTYDEDFVMECIEKSKTKDYDIFYFVELINEKYPEILYEQTIANIRKNFIEKNTILCLLSETLIPSKDKIKKEYKVLLKIEKLYEDSKYEEANKLVTDFINRNKIYKLGNKINLVCSNYATSRVMF